VQLAHPSVQQKLNAIGRRGVAYLFASALLGGVVTGALAFAVSAALPRLFWSNGLFPYVIPEVLVNDLASIAWGSTFLALPISLLFGAPTLALAFLLTTWPRCIATFLGGCIGPLLLASMLSPIGDVPLPPYSAYVFASVALIGAVGACVSALLFVSWVGTAPSNLSFQRTAYGGR
jgi:hypothetical protein